MSRLFRGRRLLRAALSDPTPNVPAAREADLPRAA
jgi:hypothetical protein